MAQTSDSRQLHNVALTSNTPDNRSRKRGRNLDTLQTPSTSSIACAACCANCVRYVLAYAGTAYIHFRIHVQTSRHTEMITLLTPERHTYVPDKSNRCIFPAYLLVE